METIETPKDQSWFVTLTYDNDHLKIPEYIELENHYVFDKQDWWKGTLVKEDCDRFINNLKKKLRKTGKPPIKYMLAGEYGEEGSRPHYHLIIWGLELGADDLYNPRIINKEWYYQSKLIESCWIERTEDGVRSRGISNVSSATWNTIAYTARYITKKINGNGSEMLYAANGQIKEFFRCSKGIGKAYYDKHKEEIYANDQIMVKNKKGVSYSKPPHYFDKLYEKENPEHFAQIKAAREKAGQDQINLLIEQTSLFKREQLEVDERAKEAQSKQLRRQLESGRQ